MFEGVRRPFQLASDVAASLRPIWRRDASRLIAPRSDVGGGKGPGERYADEAEDTADSMALFIDTVRPPLRVRRGHTLPVS